MPHLITIIVGLLLVMHRFVPHEIIAARPATLVTGSLFGNLGTSKVEIHA